MGLHLTFDPLQIKHLDKLNVIQQLMILIIPVEVQDSKQLTIDQVPERYQSYFLLRTVYVHSCHLVIDVSGQELPS